MILKKTFEATYPHYEFAPLVELAVTLANWLSGKSSARAHDGKRADAGRFARSAA